MMEINDLVVNVEGKTILNGVNLSVLAGEVVAIMGPNCSGKSTLAYAVAGHPKYQTSGIIKLNGKKIDDKSPDERAKLGLFLANQYPVAVSGLSVNSFLWQMHKKVKSSQLRVTNLVEFRKYINELAVSLNLNLDLLKRSLNDGFSGGEKKKLEILQMLVFEPKYIILDEIDSGLDVDALKVIAKTVAKTAIKNKIGVLVITHYNRILKYLKADKVIILEKGKIVKTGTGKLAQDIEVSGYKNEI